MTRFFVPILLLALAGAAAGFFEAAAPRQEAASAVPNTKMAFSAERARSSFDEGLDNPDVVSDMKITPSRKCGFCMGVSRDCVDLFHLASRRGFVFFAFCSIYYIPLDSSMCNLSPGCISMHVVLPSFATLTRSLLALPFCPCVRLVPPVPESDPGRRIAPSPAYKVRGTCNSSHIFVGCVGPWTSKGRDLSSKTSLSRAFDSSVPAPG